MIFYFVDLEILNSDLSGFSNTKFYSNIIFKNQTFQERLRDSLNPNFYFEIKKLADVENDLEADDDFIIWTSNIVFLDKDQQNLFLEKLCNARGSFRWSKGSGFIYKGTKSDFSNSKYIDLELEDFLADIHDFAGKILFQDPL